MLDENMAAMDDDVTRLTMSANEQLKKELHMKLSQWFKRVAVLNGFLVLAVLMSGCVAGQSIGLRHVAGSVPEFSSVKTVSVETKDSRDFIVNGDKPPSYLGLLRAGYGNPWGVKNAGNLALADQFRNDIVAELQAQGIETVASGARQISADIRDWNFDAYQNGRIWYDIDITVADASGKVLAKAKVKDEKVIRGSVMMGAVGAFKREVPLVYSGVIKELLSNREIQKALK